MAYDKKYEKIIAEYAKHCAKIANGSLVNSNESPEERIKKLKSFDDDYIAWFEYMFPNYAKRKCAGFHKKLANTVIKNKKIRALAELFRSAGKSVHICLGIPLYLYLHKNDLKFMLLIGETETKAKQLLSDIQANLQFNKRILHYYGNKFQLGDWKNGDFTTADGVKFTSLGFGQDPRGSREQEHRPDYIVVDDVDSKKHVNNDRLMRNAIDFIIEDVWGCFDSDDDAVERFVYANNNYHKNSITNRLKIHFLAKINEAKEKKEAHIFFHLRVDAVKDLQNFEPNWKEKTSAEYWRKKFGSMPFRSFLREYMNTHIEEGKVFKAEQIQFCKPLPYANYDAIVAYGDLSYEDEACHKSIVFVGKSKREFHILHIFFRQTSRSQVANWLYDIYEDKNLANKNLQYMFEGLFAMSMFLNDFDEVGDLRGYHIPITSSKRPKADKFSRIEALSGFFERRNVFFNENEKNNADSILFRDTLLAFEKGAKIPLDGLDACQGAFDQVNRISFVDKFEPILISRKNILSHSKNRF